MKLIYVAGPYTADTKAERELNIMRAEIASVQLIRKGWAVITPHKNTAGYEKYEDENLNYETWLTMDFEIISRCDAIFMMLTWRQSKGSKMELAFARDKVIAVYFELSDGIPEPPK